VWDNGTNKSWTIEVLGASSLEEGRRMEERNQGGDTVRKVNSRNKGRTFRLFGDEQPLEGAMKCVWSRYFHEPLRGECRSNERVSPEMNYREFVAPVT
jgi:hypothetical protein